MFFSFRKFKFVYIFLFLVVSPVSFAFSFSGSVGSIGQITVIINDFALLMGIGMVFGGLLKLKRYGEMRTHMSHQLSIGKPLAILFVGVCLMVLPEFTRTVSRAFWGTASPLAFPVFEKEGVQHVVTTIIMLFRLLGIFGVIRGLMLLTRVSGEQAQPGTLGKALLHLVGGIMCIHIMNVYYILKGIVDF